MKFHTRSFNHLYCLSIRDLEFDFRFQLGRGVFDGKSSNCFVVFSKSTNRLSLESLQAISRLTVRAMYSDPPLLLSLFLVSYWELYFLFLVQKTRKIHENYPNIE